MTILAINSLINAINNRLVPFINRLMPLVERKLPTHTNQFAKTWTLREHSVLEVSNGAFLELRGGTTTF